MISSTEMPAPPKGFEYLSIVVPVRTDREMTELERACFLADVEDAAERALDVRFGSARA